MTTPRATRPTVRLTPLLAWLVVSAFAAPRASAAGCAHPGDASAAPRAASTLQVTRIADEPDAGWTLPGAPCHGPRCQSKAPSANAPGALAAAPDRHQAVTLAAIFPPAPSSAAIVPNEPRPIPILAASAPERPPRDA